MPSELGMLCGAKRSFPLNMNLVLVAFLPVIQQAKSDLAQKHVEEWARDLGTKLYLVANQATQADKVLDEYEKESEVDHFLPDDELDHMVKKTEKYLELRKTLAEEARISLQNREIQANVTEAVNSENSGEFIRYINAESGTDYAFVQKYPYEESEKINAITELTFKPNPNFYGLRLNWSDSAVHVPVPVYNREETLLAKIKWSNIDDIYRDNKIKHRDLSYQFFCSESGFFRFLPSRKWKPFGTVDLFDCRTSPWYISAATGSKNIVILLDMSGSMLGQNFEIAKQTIEVIMETMSENDFFNIITFSQNPKYLSACYNRTLIQASLRNRKLLRAALNNATVGEMAAFQKALTEAFELLLNLNTTANWTTKNELPEGFVLDEHAMVFDSGHIMLLDEQYKNLVTTATNTVACNSAIMLITDGAPSTYEGIFNTYNSDKKIRFFSFLIGTEATDFMEVRWMACYNGGYMVHVSNLADVQTKIQKYVGVMSRSIALRPGVQSDVESSVWTGAYFERLFFNYDRMPNDPAIKRRPGPKSFTPRPEVVAYGLLNLKSAFPGSCAIKSMLLTTTVALPVIKKEGNGIPRLVGVVGVAVPMVELQQMAPSHRLGLNAYSFLVDNNGYVMFHPQLRPLAGSMPKPNYNSMDIMEMEPLQDQELRTLFVQFRSLTQRRRDCKLPGASEVGTESGGSLFEGDHMTYETKMRHYWEASECFMRSNETDVIEEYAKTIPLQNWTKTVSYVLGYDSELRNLMVNGNSSKGRDIRANVLLAIEEDGIIKRVYKQENKYYSRGIGGTLFSLGLAVPLLGEYRIKPRREIDYGSVKADGNDGWFSGTNWRLHPTWRYCLLNDSDGDQTREEAFVVYVKEMQRNKSLPELCKERKDLVDRLLFDAKMTAFISSKWIPEHLVDAQYGIHLVFFASESGLTRYANVNLDSIEFRYKPVIEPESSIEVSELNTTALPKIPDNTVPEPDYMHFIHTRLRGPEETYYQRAMRFTTNDTFVFDLNLKTQVYNKESRLSVYGRNETISFLVTAVRSLVLKQDDIRAPIGVIGLEMTYDKFAQLVVDASGRNCTKENMRCFLLDEHGYVVYSSHETGGYKDCMNKGYRAGCKNNGQFMCKLGQFFGDLCAPEQHVMDGLIKREIYQKVTYVDYQALCSDRTFGVKGSSSRLLSPFYNLLRAVQWLWKEIIMLIAEYSIWSLLTGFLLPVKAYTESFGKQTGLPCDKASFFYILNGSNAAKLEGGTLYGSACSDGCKIRPEVSLVPKTNLLFIAFEMDSAEKCLSDQCNKDNEAMNKVQFGFTLVLNASDKILNPRNCKAELRHRRPRESCTWINETQYNIQDCSRARLCHPCSSTLLIGICILTLLWNLIAHSSPNDVS